MVLVNGGKGIGTGFSYEGLAYNPLQVIGHLEGMLGCKSEEECSVIEPYYEGFKGTITELGGVIDALCPKRIYKKYLFKGVYKVVGVDKIRITELPIGVWTDDYKKFLDTLIEETGKNKKSKQIIKSFTDMSTDTDIDISIRFVSGAMQALLPKTTEHGCNQLEKALNLYTTKSTTNMNLFNADQHLKKYTTVYDIIRHFYSVRFNIYHKRKAYQIDLLEKEMIKLSNKARFIQEQCTDPPTLTLHRKKKAQVISILKSKGYDVIGEDKEYKYLRNMTIDSVEVENLERLLRERDNKEKQLDTLKGKSVEDIWLHELNELKIQYKLYRNRRAQRQSGKSVKKRRLGKVRLPKANTQKLT